MDVLVGPQGSRRCRKKCDSQRTDTKQTPYFPSLLKGGSPWIRGIWSLGHRGLANCASYQEEYCYFTAKGHFCSLTTEGKIERQFSPQSIFESSHLSKRKISSDLCKKESMKIWKNIFRKVDVLVLTKKLINWRDFSEIYDTLQLSNFLQSFAFSEHSIKK